MFLQIVVQTFPIIFIGIIAYMTYYLSKMFRFGEAGALQDLFSLVERTPALDTFLMLVLQCTLIVTAVFNSLMQISNHIILSLDIIYLISVLLLILNHSLKRSEYPLVKEV